MYVKARRDVIPSIPRLRPCWPVIFISALVGAALSQLANFTHDSLRNLDSIPFTSALLFYVNYIKNHATCMTTTGERADCWWSCTGLDSLAA